MLGKLGVIAVLRTELNYFLTREMAQEGMHAKPKGTADGTDSSDS